MVKDTMVTDQVSSDIGRFTARIVLDDRNRLPGRFFGRFATSATRGRSLASVIVSRAFSRDLLKEFQ
jgi:hypothetical protein